MQSNKELKVIILDSGIEMEEINNVKIIISIPIIIFVLYIILFLIKLYIKRNINKLFKNIN